LTVTPDWRDINVAALDSMDDFKRLASGRSR
jgi:hypothetical protein